jgi:hypothetical protein
MPRIAVDRAAVLKVTGRDPVPARVSDISQGGVRVESTAQFAVGTHVVVTILGLDPQPATVRWSDSGIYGLTFNRVVSLRQLVQWLHDDGLAAPLRKAG